MVQDVNIIVNKGENKKKILDKTAASINTYDDSVMVYRILYDNTESKQFFNL